MIEDAATNVSVFGREGIDDEAVKQIATCAMNAERVVLMPDAHRGYAAPIGAVIAYQDKISPMAVGYDIACGNKAVRIDADAKDVRKHIAKIMDHIWRQIQFGFTGNQGRAADHELFDDPLFKEDPMSGLLDKARDQLGSCGGGNHYVDVFVSDSDDVWIGVHFGSRGFGWNI